MDIVKNYGVIDLSYGFNYYLLKKENVTLFAAAEIGIGDLFWLKTRIDIADRKMKFLMGRLNLHLQTPSQDRYLMEELLQLCPTRKTKQSSLKPEIQWDYRLPFSKKTYPTFLKLFISYYSIFLMFHRFLFVIFAFCFLSCNKVEITRKSDNSGLDNILETNNIVRIPDSAHENLRKHFDLYTNLMPRNGMPIHILAENSVTNDKIDKVKK